MSSTSANAVTLDLEADPTAYALEGYSLHVGAILTLRTRFEVGVFSAEAPSWWSGYGGFKTRDSGATVKYDVYWDSVGHGGWFGGVDGSYVREHFRLEHSAEVADRHQSSLGPRLGYRYYIGDRFYVVPWCTLGFGTHEQEVALGGRRIYPRAISLFPALHLGWRF